jgi:hypothetical protein
MQGELEAGDDIENQPQKSENLLVFFDDDDPSPPPRSPTPESSTVLTAVQFSTLEIAAGPCLKSEGDLSVRKGKKSHLKSKSRPSPIEEDEESPVESDLSSIGENERPHSKTPPFEESEESESSGEYEESPVESENASESSETGDEYQPPKYGTKRKGPTLRVAVWDLPGGIIAPKKRSNFQKMKMWVARYNASMRENGQAIAKECPFVVEVARLETCQHVYKSLSKKVADGNVFVAHTNSQRTSYGRSMYVHATRRTRLKADLKSPPFEQFIKHCKRKVSRGRNPEEIFYNYCIILPPGTATATELKANYECIREAYGAVDIAVDGRLIAGDALKAE